MVRIKGGHWMAPLREGVENGDMEYRHVSYKKKGVEEAML